MASASISGLGSGLDTATIIEQFMQLEAVPQTKLKSRVTTEQSALTALQSLNTKLAALVTKAKDLSSADAWDKLQATSSNTAVTVTATDTATPTSLNVTVEKTALSHQVAFGTELGLDATLSAGIQVTTATGPVTLGTAGNTLADLVSSINAGSATTGIRATTVKGATGYKLLLESTTTGAAQQFTVDSAPAELGATTERAAQNAVVSLGAVTASSATNTFTDLMPGVTLTLAPTAKAGDVAAVTVSRDGTTRADALKSLVDSINSALTDIANLTSYNSTSKTAGKLQGDSIVRGVARALVDSIYPGDGTSMATYGLELTRDGKLDFDVEVFKKAYTADPAAATAAFTGVGSFSARIEKAAEAASDKYKGSITAAITGRTQGIERLQDSIERWDTRLELRRSMLTRQFTSLETALSRMNSQSSWLAGQIGSLPTSSS